MQVLYPRCCGLDVHKSSLTACILINEPNRKERLLRRFGTMTGDVNALAAWLAEHDVRKVAMESTGVYGKPIWNLLEDSLGLMLVNAQHIKAAPGRKTDIKDCEWIAELLQHGLLRGSLVSPETVRELRDLNHGRAILVQQRATVSNRIEEVLEDTNRNLDPFLEGDGRGWHSGEKGDQRVAALGACCTTGCPPKTLSRMGVGIWRWAS